MFIKHFSSTVLSRLQIESTIIINMPFSEILFISILLALSISYFLFVLSIHCLQNALLSKAFSNHNSRNVADLLTEELQHLCWNYCVTANGMQTMGEPQAWLANYRLAREFDQVTLTSCRRNKGTELPNSRKREIQTRARCAHTMHNPQVTLFIGKLNTKTTFDVWIGFLYGRLNRLRT